MFDTGGGARALQPICATVAAIATAVATKMSANLNATKKRMTGKEVEKNFTRRAPLRPIHYRYDLAQPLSTCGGAPRFARAPPGRCPGRGPAPAPRRRSRRARRAARGRARRRRSSISARVLGADRGDGEVGVQDAPRPLGVGALEVRGERRGATWAITPCMSPNTAASSCLACGAVRAPRERVGDRLGRARAATSWRIAQRATPSTSSSRASCAIVAAARRRPRSRGARAARAPRASVGGILERDRGRCRRTGGRAPRGWRAARAARRRGRPAAAPRRSASDVAAAQHLARGDLAFVAERDGDGSTWLAAGKRSF